MRILGEDGSCVAKLSPAPWPHALRRWRGLYGQVLPDERLISSLGLAWMLLPGALPAPRSLGERVRTEGGGRKLQVRHGGPMWRPVASY